MAKDKDDIFTGEMKVDKFEQSKKSNSSTDGMVEVMFKENRSFDLHIGRECFMFEPYGRKFLRADLLSHPDFIQQSKLFEVRGK